MKWSPEGHTARLPMQKSTLCPLRRSCSHACAHASAQVHRAVLRDPRAVPGDGSVQEVVVKVCGLTAWGCAQGGRPAEKPGSALCSTDVKLVESISCQSLCL